ncbi:MAG: RIP metalloprotease RseP [Alphaproteobacteria bacterium]|nr:RIP metalloprotease RseP [Alphaproteobacteria bacterium]MBQ7286119.1 RIP metalloprotease RseP [Alphaproteobacteria bacterium]
MDWLSNTVYYIVPFIVLLGILVFVHELGHFLVARLCGVKVTDFSIGFGRKLWGWTDSQGTEWKLSLIPLGGYCKFLGDEDAASSSQSEKEISEDERKYAFANQNPLKKLAIVIAGPAANYLFAIVVFASIFFFIGKMDFPAVVGGLVPGGAAEKAGVLKGDKILAVNNKKVATFTELRQEVDMHVDEKIKLEIERDGKIIHLSFPLQIVPLEVVADQDAKPRPMLGVHSLNAVEINPVQVSLGEALADSLKETWRITEVTLRGLGQMITGRRNADEVGGILRIAEMSGDISKERGLIDFIIFMALLSINLGLINLFPIPLLDGGHVVIYSIEIIARREINEKAKEYIFRFGLFVLVSLMLFATYNDFARLFHRWFS